jgi:hypothetical protein
MTGTYLNPLHTLTTQSSSTEAFEHTHLDIDSSEAAVRPGIDKMALVESHWIKFLRQYGPIPRNDNMYDEAIQRVLKRGKIQPIVLESKYRDELISNFKSSTPCSVILTGTAGDGKTYYCRQIWQALGGTNEAWDKGDKIQYLNLGPRRLVIIKDLSELSSSEKNILVRMADAIMQSSHDEIYLVAANDGQLIEAWKSIEDTNNVCSARQLIEDLLVEDRREKEGISLQMYNLSRLKASENLEQVLNAVITHPGWSECNHCFYREGSTTHKKCPIWENKLRIEESVLKQRIIELVKLCELNDTHLPMRQLLLLAANALLGHPDAKDRLMDCKQVPKLLEADTSYSASVYRNIFGENLPEHRRETTDIFATLNRFGIGKETSNRIDNTLIFGEDDEEMQSQYEALVLNDSYYGSDQKFRAEQRSYLEGTSSDDGEKFLSMLSSQRQRLFFTVPEELVEEVKLWELSVFQNAGEYLKSVYGALQRSEKVPKQILSRLIRGINRIFTGLLTRDSDQLFLATSGSDSQARVSRILEGCISVKNQGERIAIELDSDSKVNLVVSFSTSSEVPPVKLRLNLVRYEFLCRVGEGALPSSFSRECYEDMLAFKTRLLRQLELRHKHESAEEDIDEDYMALKLIELDSDGKVDVHSLEVRL